MITNTAVLYIITILVVIGIVVAILSALLKNKKAKICLIAVNVIIVIAIFAIPIQLTPIDVLSYSGGTEYVAVEAYFNDKKLDSNDNYSVVLEDGQRVIADYMIYGETNSYIKGCSIIQKSKSGIKIKSNNKNILIIKPVDEANSVEQ